MEKQQIYTDKNTFVQITWSDDSTSIGKMMYYVYDDDVYFVAPYNFETKMLIGENYQHCFIEFYK